MGPYFGRTGGLMRRDQEFMGTEERGKTRPCGDTEAAVCTLGGDALPEATHGSTSALDF